MGVDGSMEVVLARAIGSPGSLRFSRSGVVEVVVDDAVDRLAGLGERGLCRVGAAQQLLACWRGRLAELDVATGGGDRGVRVRWRGVAGVALALSAVADPEWPAGPADVEVLRGAVFFHALGVLYREGELARLWRDPVGELARHHARVTGLVWAAQAAVVGEGAASEEPWLWLELEEAAARAAAAAAIVVLDIA